MGTEDLFEYSENLGRVVRKGSWEEQSVGTFTKVVEALNAEDAENAFSFMDFFMQEAKVIYLLFSQINPDLESYLITRGMKQGELDGVVAGIHSLIVLPDGSPYEREPLFAKVERLVGRSKEAIERGNWANAQYLFEQGRETLRQQKDRDHDFCYGLIETIVRNHGESAIGDMWDNVIKPLFDWRYADFGLKNQEWDKSLDQLLMVACESMRAHLVGVERTGDFELVEFEDRFVLRFDPCGTGGRVVRGDNVEGTPSRMEAPYNWTVSSEPHPWNHGKKGICHYCTHCIRLMEEMPIDRFGFPLRVVDPPIYPDNDPDNRQKCQWQMFKNPATIPDEYYTRVGRERPANLLEVEWNEERADTSGFLGKG
jgi:hypothetical protein